MKDEERYTAGDGDYEFMTETIKRHPVNKRKLFKKIFLTIFLGLLFGVCACLAFLLCFPRLQVYFNPPSDTKPVSLPVAESTQDEEPIEPFVLPEQDVTADVQEGGADNTTPEAGEEEAAEKPAQDLSSSLRNRLPQRSAQDCRSWSRPAQWLWTSAAAPARSP